MKQIQQKQLTENGLILELEKAGFGGISKRTIGDWRREGLLPDFDITGRGLGKGLGRTESSWENSLLVIEQAQWICRMRSAGIGHGDLHLNLWVLGYPTLPEDVRNSLLEPLIDRIEMLESEAQELQQKWQLDKRTNGILEDVINDGTTAAISKMRQNPLEPLVMPQELMEAIANIFLNPEYDLNDFSFAESFTALEAWNSKTQKFESEMFEAENVKIEKPANQNQDIFNLLNNADFIQRHLSLHQVEISVRECTHEELAEVQNDIGIIAKIFIAFIRSAQTVLPHIRLLSDSSPASDQFLPILFNFAEYLILADISLRRNGYSEPINKAREQVLDKIEKAFSEKVYKEIKDSSPAVGEAISQTFEMFEKKMIQMAANSM